MQTYASLAEHEFHRLVEEEVERLKNVLATNTFNDIGQFRYVMGEIAGLRRFEELIEIAKERADQRNR